ncbi:MAG: SH3 domain-containing protein [Chloroflexi bacterium]|nr:SH3 domain-containing protein [Chloroflexota bacterium]
MRVRLRLVAAILLLGTALGQAQPNSPVVVFVEERTLRTASITDIGPDGLTELARLFASRGAAVDTIGLDAPIPEATSVVVLVRPRRPLRDNELARLWGHLRRGGHLLLAIDPPGQEGSSDRAGGGLDDLLVAEYAVHLTDGLLVEPWSVGATARNLRRSTIYAQAGTLPHPVTAPLQQFDMPVLMWGARALESELLGLEGGAVGVLAATPAFAETDSRIYSVITPTNINLNIGTDLQGHLTTLALAESRLTGSRIAVLGDSEVLQNGFSFAALAGGALPRHPGNTILVQRLVGWLLDQPESAWSVLPDGFTLIGIDGDASDWGDAGLTTPDEADQPLPAFDIRAVRAFRNEDAYYLLIETNGPPQQDTVVEIDLAAGGGTVLLSADNRLLIGDDGALNPLTDAAIAVDAVIEIRLPLRVTGTSAELPAICITPAETVGELADCIEGTRAAITGDREVTRVRETAVMLANVVGTVPRPNVRSGPSTDFTIVTSLPRGEVVAVIGRNEAADWLQIRTLRYTGWMADFLLQTNGVPESLPITAP